MQDLHRLIAGALLAAGVVGATAGCTTSGQAHAPQAQVSAYVAAQAEVRRHANGVAACSSTLTGMRATVTAYNAMIAKLNASQSMSALGGTDRAVITRLDRDLSAIRTALAQPLPDEVKRQMTATADAAGKVRKAVADKQRDALNPAARTWDEARRQLVKVCGGYLPA